ncbi:MAG: primosomal protein N' [Vicinamibacteria bacterium]|nr:primosomal protein N' [Vicinamibacteria bacterium]
MSAAGRIVSVAVPLPVQAPFTYRVPDELPSPVAGCRVLVPFGAQRVVGMCLGPAVTPPAGTKLKALMEVVDEQPLVAPPLLELAAWVAEHYLAPPGECYRLILPPAGGRRGAALADTAAGFKHDRVAVLLDASVATRGVAQREALARLAAAGGRARVADLARDRAAIRGALEALAARGAVEFESERVVRSPVGLPALPERERPELTDEQAVALSAICAALDRGGFQPFLLHGVTGSGKTEVYLRGVERTLETGRGALLLVPEIALTPLLVRAAAARFGDLVAVQHSELSAGERHDQWWRIREGDARVVVGARSAVFAPVRDLGLIVVDEEHEAAYKQEESPRYHGRDVAVMRARFEGAVALLGSATPALESWSNALSGKYERLSLRKRIGSFGLPRVEIVDRRDALRAGDSPILTAPLREALELRLSRGEQSLLLLNRRGWATSLLCRECGEPLGCPRCSVALTLHERGALARCHYCGHDVRAPDACAGCKGVYLRLTGFGTERVLEAVQAALPTARVGRLDRDTAQRRGAVANLLHDFERGLLDILVGTQMLAKGHDFPKVTLVGVVDADVGLGLPDFRAAERTFELLTQVAGRAGRAELAGEVILQSHRPDHYALRLACDQDYEAFYARESEFRRTMGWPPFASLVNVVVRSRDAEAGRKEAGTLAEALRAAAQRRFRVLGPGAAPLARIKDEHRFQIVLRGPRKAMRDALRTALVARHGPVRWPGLVIDVDALSVL